MIIGIFGESCTGKSKIAELVSQQIKAEIYTGKDYLKLAKNEAEAKKQFIELLNANETSDHYIIYVISEKEHLSLLPEKSLRILVTADLAVIKERFSQRMHGTLPIPIALMLERKHGIFDDERNDLHIDNSNSNSLDDIYQKILGLLKIR